MGVESPLRLIGTPIGNLGDITLRAIECLREAEVIACEDTRRARRLLSHLEIHDKELVALHDHNEKSRSSDLAERAAGGTRIAVISDAGMPTVSDPGYRLVVACREIGLRVEVIPGPSAVTTALAGSGLPSDAFHFGGFLPVKSGRRRRELEAALERRETSIFFESPYRIGKTLEVLSELDPTREACIARELTKKFETFHRGTAADLAAEFGGAAKVKGEITLLIRGAGRPRRGDGS